MFRVRRIDDEEFVVEERYLWWWWNAAFYSTCGMDQPLHFKSIKAAVDWVNETKALRHEAARKRAEKAKNIVVWQDE